MWFWFGVVSFGGIPQVSARVFLTARGCDGISLNPVEFPIYLLYHNIPRRYLSGRRLVRFCSDNLYNEGINMVPAVAG